MKYLLLIFSTVLFFSCNQKTKQIEHKKLGLKIEQPLEVKPIEDTLKIISIGYGDTYDSLPKLKFDTLSKSDFDQIQSKKFLVQKHLKEKGNYFFIKTDKSNHQFKKLKDYGGEDSWSGYEFFGFYPTLNLYAITSNSTAESLGFSDLILLDSLTDYSYGIIGFGDGSVELPIPSPNFKYLVYYYNSVYEHKNAAIGILKINDKSNPNTYLKPYASFNSKEFAIEEMKWKTDHCLYVKGYEEVYEKEIWVKKYGYYQTTFE
ncbi:MAG: hypothetical protein ABIP95_04755 [Pelobium sp.]